MAKANNKPNVKSEDKNIIIFRDVFKITEAYIEPAVDPTTKRFAPCVRMVDDKGNLILSEQDKSDIGAIYIGINEAFNVKDGVQLDLNQPHDKAWWEAIRFSPLIAQSGRWETDAKGKLIIDGDAKRYGAASFYIEVPGEESKKNVSKVFLINDAIQLIKNDTYEGLSTKTRLLGNWMKDANMADVQDYLISHAQKNPQKVIDLYDEVNASYEILLLDAVEKRVIRQERGIFYYGTTQLGASRDSVLETLKNDQYKSILENIKKELYG